MKADPWPTRSTGKASRCLMRVRPGPRGAGSVWKSGNLEIWEFGDLGAWKSRNLEIWGPGNPEIWGPKNEKNKNSQNPNPFCPKCRQGLDQ